MFNQFQNFWWRAFSVFSVFGKKGRFLPRIKTHERFPSKYLKRKVRFDVFLPPGYNRQPEQAYPLLIFNDGQDMEGVSLKKNLQQLYRKKKIRPIIAVGIHAGDRMQEYGAARYEDYKKRGKKAGAYAQFIVRELIPFLKKTYRLDEKKAIAGFSLGGLSAFDIAWNNSEVFSKVGVFSGSFWWRSEPFDPDDPDGHRIAHTMVQQSTQRKKLSFWFQTGTLDEEADRNNNGIIDSIDDTRDLIEELRKKGYHEGRDIHYVELLGGRHDTQTWGKVMPEFLIWCYGNLS